MNILLTNDDGYFALGIKILKEKLVKYGRVVIVAPKEAMSAKSVSITLGRSSKVEKIEDDVYAMEGTPADCVAFGLSSLNIRFDLVVSGCNHGFNISYDIMYSGTVGACLQALTYRKPAIAVSCDSNFDIIEENFDTVMEYVLTNNLLSNEYLLNINFPIGDFIDKILLTNIYYREQATYYIECGENDYYAYREIDDENCDNPFSDVFAVYHHHVSITKIGKTWEYKEN